jgi:putative ABC transport system permease protein
MLDSTAADFAQDLRYAVRLIRRQPRFALLVTLTMALGISATTLLFSVTYGVLLRPLPWPNGDRLVLLKETRGGVAPRFGSMTNAAFLAWRDEATTVEGLAAWSQRLMTLSGAGEPERLRVTAATASLFPVLGVRPLIGSAFEERHELEEGGPVVVLSERLWRQRFGADPGMLGRAVQLDAVPYTVLGVLPDAAAFPDRQTQAWVPFRVQPATGNLLSMFSAVATLRAGATPAQAAAEGTGRGRFAPDTGLTTTAIFGSAGPIEIAATPLREALTADVRGPLVALLIAVLLLLVTATANVAGLQLARATTRRRELAIRAALGAGGARVMRQLLVESLMLAALGGAVGLALAALLHAVMPTVLPADFPRVDALAVDGAVALFALVASMLTGIVFGVFPALRVRRLNLVDSLSDDGVGAVAGGRSKTAQARMVIMGGQVAIACVLLVGASLLGRSFVAMLQADRGYDPAGVLTSRLSLSPPGYTPERRFAAIERILDRLAGAPGAAAVAFTSEMPLTPGGSTSAFSIPSRLGDGGTIRVQASPRIVSPRVFAALGLRIVDGRGFTPQDSETSMPVVVVNRAFARRYLGHQPIGARLPIAGYGSNDEQRESTVVGVVDDVRYVSAGDSSQPELYYSYRQMGGRLPVGVVTLLVRTANDPRRLASALRAAVREADDRLVADAVLTLEERLLTTLARPRLYAIVLGGFAAFALAIAAVGLFGVLSYSVAQRSRELAVRSALGARPFDLVRLVVWQGVVVTAAGLGAGLLGSLWLTRAIATQLYGVTTTDAVTYAVVPLLLVLVAAVACVVPARRAATLDPLTVLRGH